VRHDHGPSREGSNGLRETSSAAYAGIREKGEEASSERSTDPKREPLSILEERFARGEIDTAELESRRAVLTKS
jgi:uncharacterized membrane protein